MVQYVINWQWNAGVQVSISQKHIGSQLRHIYSLYQEIPQDLNCQLVLNSKKFELICLKTPDPSIAAVGWKIITERSH